MLVIKQLPSVLVLYGEHQKPWLAALKKEILTCMGQEKHKWKVEFASSKGVEASLLGQIAERYTHVIIVCPAAAALVCPKGISFTEAGGSFYRNARGDLKYLILTDPQHLFTVAHGSFLVQRYLSKIFQPHIFMQFPAFKWKRIRTPEEFASFLSLAESAIFAAFDIETVKRNLGISTFGMALLLPSGQITVGVLDCEDDNFLGRVGALCRTAVPKTAQNGIYDNLYLLRWNCPVTNYVHDTAAYFHSWYCELDKDLGSLGAFFLHGFEYWKQEAAQSMGKEDYHRYNAKDCYATLCIAVAMLRESPAYAKRNFVINFPRVFPCILMSASGILVDEELRTQIRQEAERSLAETEERLRVMTSLPAFNANSSDQVKLFFKALGVPIESSDEKSLLAVAARHPLYELFVDAILEIRGLKKSISTYYNAKLLVGESGENPTLLYDLSPYGTETGRLASKKSSFWCGAQIQNQPPYAKQYLMAPDGWEFEEIDNEQSESRTTAYLAECETLQRTLESGKDFHSTNAVVFFGADYDAAKQKQDDGSDSPVRALAKRINHAVSYNMGANEFVRNAGNKTMETARRLLGLSPFWSHKRIAEYLIGLFDAAYPEVRGSFQQSIKREIAFTKMLVGATGWTRRFFRDPSTNKMALNAAVAHGPQSLSVQVVNEGMMRMYKLQMSGYPIRIKAQVHDSMLFLRRVGDEACSAAAKECMHNPIMVKGKLLVIPTASKVTGKYWGKRKKVAVPQ